MGYHVAFDVAQNGLQWMVPFVASMCGGLFLLLGWAIRRSGDREVVFKGFWFQLFGGIGVLFALIFLVSDWSVYRSASKALSDHDYSVAEGVVSEFKPMPPGGHANESFRIGGVSFSYGSGFGSTVFNSAWNNGMIHDGVAARIYYRGPDILRVEVK
jgi:hypothetical protein